MAFTYTLIVDEDKPEGKAPGTIWIKKSVGTCQILFNDLQHVILPSSGQGSLSIADGTYFRSVTESTTPPGSPLIGDIWLQTDQNAYWIYLGQWTPFAGG